MSIIKVLISLIFSISVINVYAQEVVPVNHFNKVILSPSVQATFIEGNEEAVTIMESSVAREKINIEVNGNTLRIYLDGAKEIPKKKKGYKDGYETKVSIYTDTAVQAIITYKKLDVLSVRGAAKHVCQSSLTGKDFKLRLYGESEVELNNVNLENLQATLYGDTKLKIYAGNIQSQKYTAYGEGVVDCLGITGKTSIITAYGKTSFKMNVTDDIRITSFGSPTLAYKSNPSIHKGINIGDAQITKLQ